MKTTKAVILAGGRGERMRPLTDIIPKALIPINGVSILAQQLAQLERLGFKDVIILTGYLSKSIEIFCKNYSTTLNIKCIASEPLNTPAERLLNSREAIGDKFLLVYCDNFITSDIAIQKVLSCKEDLTFLVESRSRGNIEIRSGDFASYHVGPRSDKFCFVELGNISIRSRFFFDCLELTHDLPSALEMFSKEVKCGVIKTDNCLMSISNFERFLKLQSGRTTIILDRDGVLIKKMPKRKYVTTIEDYVPLINNWEGLRQLSEVGVDFILATNQPGVALGEVNENFLSELHQLLAADLLVFGIRLLSVYVCPHHWDSHCGCRKPKPGMLLKAIDEFRLNHKETIYIGDDDRDLAAAEGAGIPGLLLGDEHSADQLFPDALAAVSHVKQLLKLVQ